jgi:signal transduction histidine kinase
MVTCNEAEAWNTALVEISRGIAELEDADALLFKIVDTAMQLLNADMAALGVWDTAENCVELEYYVDETQQCRGSLYKITDTFLQDTITACRSTRYPQDFCQETESHSWEILKQKLSDAIIISLKLEDQPFGALWVGRRTGPPFTTSDVVGLEHLGDQAVIAISHTFMAARLQSLAVMDERARIAREMHDGLAQLLGYLRLETQTLEELVQQGNHQLVLNKLKQCRQNIDIAQADVRENILSLRTTLSNEGGAITALEEYLQEFGIQTGIEVRFENEITEKLNISPLAECQMVRIIQEALTNVRKHACAKHVLLHLEILQNNLSVTVADDGCGFEYKTNGKSFGLETMQERAEAVGGEFAITTTLDAGTQVFVKLPLLDGKSINRLKFAG